MEVQFCLKEDSDNIIAELTEYLKGISTQDHDHRWDETNHNEFQGWASHEMRDEHHCWLYHCLYDHAHLSWEDILRIGDIWFDIKATYQYVGRDGKEG